MITNQQFLSNDHLHPATEEHQTPSTDHDLEMLFSERGWISPYWPLGVCAIVFTLFYFFVDSLNKFFSRHFKSFKIGDELVSLEEGLDNYWCALSKQDKRWTIREENYRRDALGMKMMTDE